MINCARNCKDYHDPDNPASVEDRRQNVITTEEDRELSKRHIKRLIRSKQKEIQEKYRQWDRMNKEINNLGSDNDVDLEYGENVTPDGPINASELIDRTDVNINTDYFSDPVVRGAIDALNEHGADAVEGESEALLMDIKSLSLELDGYYYSLKIIDNNELEAKLAKERSGDQYKIQKSAMDDVNSLIKHAMSVRFVIEDYPKDLEYKDTEDFFNSSMNRLSPTYTYAVKSIFNEFSDIEEKYQGQPYVEQISDAVALLKTTLPPKITTLAAGEEQRNDKLIDVNTAIDLLLNAKAVVFSKIQDLTGKKGLKSRRAERFLNRSQKIFQSPALADVVSQKETLEVVRERARKRLRRSEEKINEFRQMLKNATSLLSIPEEKKKKFKDVILKDSVLGRIARTKVFNLEKSNEEYWRNRIRERFGGNIPFCDEVMDSNGYFIKKSDATERHNTDGSIDIITKEQVEAIEAQEEFGKLDQAIG